MQKQIVTPATSTIIANAMNAVDLYGFEGIIAKAMAPIFTKSREIEERGDVILNDDLDAALFELGAYLMFSTYTRFDEDPKRQIKILVDEMSNLDAGNLGAEFETWFKYLHSKLVIVPE